MLTRRQFLGYSAVAPAVLRPALWADQTAPKALEKKISARALAVHKRALVFDGHVHALDREFYHGDSMGDRKSDGYWDLPRAREGGVGAFFLSIYVPERYYPGRFETKQTRCRIDHAHQQL